MKRIYTYMCLLLLSVLSFAVTGCDDDDDDDADDDADEEPSRKDPGIGGMFAAFKSEFDKAAKGE